MSSVLGVLWIGAKFVWRHRHAIVKAHRAFVKHDTDLEKVVDFIDGAPGNFKNVSR